MASHPNARNAQIYPLTSESSASKANYFGMDLVDPVYRNKSLAVLHGWHAAKAFLYLRTMRARNA